MAGNSGQDRDARVDELVAEVVRLRESGDEGQITELLAQHPDLADSVEGFLRDQEFFTHAAKVSQTSIDTDANEARQTKVKPRDSTNDPSTSASSALAAAPDGAANNASGPAASAVGSPEGATTYVMALPAEIVAGVKLLGRYRIENLLGEGAMGAVYLAHDTQLDRKVALKTPKFNSDNAIRLGKRFRREAQSAATLHHRNICPVYDVGQIDGIDYLTMAYIEGKPLSAYVNPDKPLAQRQVALVIRKLAIALQAAHDAGVVHRDLKPSNVIIDREGEPVVMDFGLAGRVDMSGDSRLTKTGTILGTPAYMAPEQIEGAQKLIGPRSDIYALGTVMYELLAGRLPFRGSPASVMGKVLVAKPPSLQELRADVDSELAKICEAMMVKHPSKRIASMKEVAEQLTTWIRNSRQTEQTPQASSSVADSPPVQNIVTTGEEMAALPKQAALNWKVEANDISDARKTNEVKPIGRWLKTKAWFASLPPRNRRLLTAAAAALPLLLFLGVTIIIKINIDDDGKVTTEVTREPTALAAGPGDTTPNDAELETSPVGARIFGPWITLFDGNGTSEWEHLGVFRVSGNELVAGTKGAAKSKQVFDDFELEFEWKLERGGNSGVYYRADPGVAINVWPRGSAEFALDGTASPRAEEDNGALWNVLSPTTIAHIDPNRFRTAKIVCHGSEVEHWIGGILVLKYDTSSPSFQRSVAASRNQHFKASAPRDSGRIYLQSNVGEIRFRNIRIREIIRPQISGVSITARDLHFLGSTRKSDGWHGWNTLQVNHDGNPVIVSEWGSEPKGLYQMTSQGSLIPIATGDLFIDPESFAETDDGYYVTNAGGQGTVVFVPKNGDVPTRIGSDQLYDPYGILVAPPTFQGPNVAPGDLIVFDNAAGDKDRQGIKSFNRQAGTVKLLCRQGSFGGGFNTKGELFAIDNTQKQTTSIVKIDASGSVETVLSHFPWAAGYVGSAGHLAIHPTTDVFYFSVDGTVYAYKDSSEQPRPIIDGGFHVNDWSPDGKLLYLQKDKFEVWALEHAYIQRVLAQDRSAGVHPAIPPDAAVFEGHSYKVFAEVLSWKDAQRRCEAMGGHLATISHSAENRFVLNLVRAKFPKPEFRDAVWLGATDEVNEGQWIWVDGQPVDFTNWFKPEGAGQQGGQPNNKCGIEHYMIMWFGNGERVGDEWCDQPNVSTQHRCYFVCEWDGLPIARTSNPAPTAITAGSDSEGLASTAIKRSGDNEARPAASAVGSQEQSHPQRYTGVSNARSLESINQAAGTEGGGIETLWVSSDGLDIYWRQTDWRGWGTGRVKDGVWQAQRRSTSGVFADARRVLNVPSFKPSVTDDGLYMICTKHPATGTIYETSRSSKSGMFSTPRPIKGITESRAVREASVSPDGKTLVFAEGWKKATKIYVCRRSSRSRAWGPRTEVKLRRDSKFDIGINFPRISNDGKTLWFQFGSGWPYQYAASGVRSSVDQPFTDFKYVRLHGRPLLSASACVVPGAKQIFYTAPSKAIGDAYWEAWSADLHEHSVGRSSSRTLADKTFHLEFLAADLSQTKHFWGNYEFHADGAITRNGDRVGTWKSAPNDEWAAGEDGFDVVFTSPHRMTAFVSWVTEDRIVGGIGAIFSGQLVDQ